MATTTGRPDAGGRAGAHGILVPDARLDRLLHGVLVALLLVCALRYVDRHGLDASAAFVLAGAAGLAIAYTARPLVARHRSGPTAWVVLLVVLWAALTVVAPSFAWTAVPIAFAVLQVLPFSAALVVVVAMTALVGVAWSRITTELDPTVVVGPVGIALVTVMAFRALETQARQRQRLLDDLTDAQADLATAQRRSGALAERTRLSREIHDSVGQGLSSINLLLQAAEQSWDARPDAARAHVGTAAATARDGLDEVRRVVRDLAPVELADDDTGAALPAALERVARTDGHGVAVDVRVHGDVVPVPPEVAAAVVRSARGALANVVEHSGAARAVVSVTYLPDEVRLDVRDDGRGLPGGVDGPATYPAGERGHGLRGIRDRAELLGGRATVESAPGDGTTVSVALPLAPGPR